MSEDKIRDIFGNERPFAESRPVIHEAMERSVAKLQGMYPDNMAAFITFAVGNDGAWALGYRIDPESFIGPTMLVGLACEAIRRDVLVGPDIDKAINGEVTAY